MSRYDKLYKGKVETPQSEAIPGSTQVPNSAGGFAWQVDDWERLHRFLILGSDQGTYYIKAKQLTRENAECVLRCLAADAERTVQIIRTVSHEGRAPKNDPAIFALALCLAEAPLDKRRVILGAIPDVCRIGTHLFHFMQYYTALTSKGTKDGRNSRGRFGRSIRRQIAKWYEGRNANSLGTQVVKYAQRDGWSHKDVLILSHPKPVSLPHKATYEWVMRGTRTDELPKLVHGLIALQGASSVKQAASIITQYELPREAVERVNTEWLKDKAIWDALFPQMPMEAMIRNLGVMTDRGVAQERKKEIIERLTTPEKLHESRIHPIKVLAALLTYSAGRGSHRVKRDNALTWEPVQQIVDALDQAFYLSFKNVPATGKRIMLACDVSGSMGYPDIADVPGLTPRVAVAALSLVTANVESDYMITGFTAAGGQRQTWRTHHGDDGISPLRISPRQRLDDVVKYMDSLAFGGTDCSLPMQYAEQHKLSFDAFVVLTDNETWAGGIHPAQALKRYRAAMNLPAKLIVVGMVANSVSIADPTDAGMLDVVGFDTAVPAVMADFIAR